MPQHVVGFVVVHPAKSPKQHHGTIVEYPKSLRAFAKRTGSDSFPAIQLKTDG